MAYSLLNLTVAQSLADKTTRFVAGQDTRRLKIVVVSRTERWLAPPDLLVNEFLSRSELDFRDWPEEPDGSAATRVVDLRPEHMWAPSDLVAQPWYRGWV
jgi:hypothetical protein